MRNVVFVLLLFYMSPTFAAFNEAITPIPIPNKPSTLLRNKIALGNRLFHDPSLSANNKIACSSCHIIKQGGVVPGLTHSIPGVSGKTIKVNIPTVLNSALNTYQFWDGRALSLEEQLDGPLLHPDEMGNTWPKIIKHLRTDPYYRTRFIELYGERPNRTNIKNAIVEYEKSLITPNSTFDQYLRGNKSAISEQAKQGYALFKSYGCISCHQGVNVGGNVFQSVGIYELPNGFSKTDLNNFGRFHLTREESDRFVFRVPSLRNVARTAPYFHNGSAATLPEAVKLMAQSQLGIELSKQDVQAIVAFLETLNAKVYQQ